MPSNRVAVVLLAAVALFSAVGGASAATSKLTPTPPVPLPSAPSGPPPSETTTTMTSTTVSVPADATKLPHTGADLAPEVLLGLGMTAAGVLLRLRRPTDRSAGLPRSGRPAGHA